MSEVVIKGFCDGYEHAQDILKLYYEATDIYVSRLSILFPVTSYANCKFVLVFDKESKDLKAYACVCPIKDIDGSTVTSLVNKASEFMDSLYVMNVVTKPSYQKQGCARIIVETIVEHFGDSNNLLVDTELDYLKRMFERMGFEEQKSHFILGSADVTYLRTKTN
jgi:ribosomal protein S18 acetylase RimI-like enzyme